MATNATTRQTLKKAERITCRKDIEQLFGGGGSRAMSAFPIRMVYLKGEQAAAGQPQAQMLVSVPKRHFKRAVKRNRVKRQVREAYRKNKQALLAPLAAHPEARVSVAFIWLDDKLWASDEVESRVRNLLERLGEKL